MKKIVAIDDYMNLKIAVFGFEEPEAGGASVAEALLLQHIRGAIRENDSLIFPENEKHLFIKPHWVIKIVDFLSIFRALHFYGPTSWIVNRKLNSSVTSHFEKKLLKEKVDIVFFTGPFRHAIQLKKIPYITNVWDIGHRDLIGIPEVYQEREFEMREWNFRNLVSKSFAVIVESGITKEKLKQYYGIADSRIQEVHFTLEPLPQRTHDRRESFALYPAHFWSHKNHKVLISALHRLSQEGRAPRKLVLTGADRGNLDFIRNLANQLNVSQYIEFRGFISKVDLNTLYSSAAITLMPSYLGPTNLPPIEGLLRGCPVVVTPEGSANIANLQGVMVLEGNDVSGWAKLLDSETNFPIVSVADIEEHFAQVRLSNIKALQVVFDSFRIIKGTYSS